MNDPTEYPLAPWMPLADAADDSVLVGPHDGFDLDLYSIMPDFEENLSNAARDLIVWAFGSKKDDDAFSSITYWNTVGLVILSDLDEVKKDRDGYYSVRAHTTRADLFRVSIESIIRYCWVQNYTAALHWRRWIIGNPQLQRYQQEILCHIRGWDEIEDFTDKLQFVRDWAFGKAIEADIILTAKQLMS